MITKIINRIEKYLWFLFLRTAKNGRKHKNRKNIRHFSSYGTVSTMVPQSVLRRRSRYYGVAVSTMALQRSVTWSSLFWRSTSAVTRLSSCSVCRSFLSSSLISCCWLKGDDSCRSGLLCWPTRRSKSDVTKSEATTSWRTFKQKVWRVILSAEISRGPYPCHNTYDYVLRRIADVWLRRSRSIGRRIHLWFYLCHWYCIFPTMVLGLFPSLE